MFLRLPLRFKCEVTAFGTRTKPQHDSLLRLFCCSLRREFPMKIFVFALLGALFISTAVCATSGHINLERSDEHHTPLGIGLEGLIGHSPQFLPIRIQNQDVRMAYVDFPPDYTGGFGTGQPQLARGTILLLHSKNFFGDYWGSTAKSLITAGYRVIVPDQIGFGRSSKPDLNYSFEMLADNTAKLLDELKVQKVIVVGHSMGGMLAVKFARRFPNRVEKLVLENPIGLEDYGRATGKVPLERLYQAELSDTDPFKILDFYKRYFVTWKSGFESLAEPRIRVTLSGEYPRWAKASAGTYKMILEQPIVGDLPKLRVPTLLIIGQEDRTIVGKNYMKIGDVARFGNYPALGKTAAQMIPGARLVEISNVGHIPHIEAPEAFHNALLGFISSP